MDKLSKGLKTVDEKVAELRDRFETFTKEATQIKIDLDREQEIISVAETLVSRLDGEYKRWNQQVCERPGLLFECSTTQAPSSCPGWDTFCGLGAREGLGKGWH